MRTRIRYIEVDLMMGSNHKSALLLMTDRTTLITMLEKLQSKNVEGVYEKIKGRLIKLKSCWIKRITFDNGKEFSNDNKTVKDLNLKTYFKRPYNSQDKGTVENRIGLIKWFFPKKTDLRKVSSERIKEVEKTLNYIPIRKFNYFNPIEKLKTQCVVLMS